MYTRTGECNQCGQCCGGSDAPNPVNPWTASYPESIRLWSDDDLNRELPLWREMGLARINGEIDYHMAGTITVGEVELPYVWDKGWRKPDSVECPCLLPDAGDGKRPCALVGSELEHGWTNYCKEGPDGAGFPPLESTQAQVATWFARHPKCSYVYVEVDDGAE